LKTGNTQDHSGFFRKGGEEMAKKKQSKGNFFNFIDDAAKDPILQKEMLAVIKKKGAGWTGSKLLKRFHELNYDGVSLRDCNRVLIILKTRVKNPLAWDWSY
jgi:hypothetical protein